MKRIKVAQNRFLTLFRLESDTGSTLNFELVRTTRFPHVAVAAFKPTDWKQAGYAFTIATCAMKTAGLHLRTKTVRRIVDRSVDFSSGIRRFKSRYRKRKPKRTTPINPI